MVPCNALASAAARTAASSGGDDEVIARSARSAGDASAVLDPLEPPCYIPGTREGELT